MANRQVEVGTTAVLLVAADPHDQTVIIHNHSGAIYVGNAGVTESNGFQMHNDSVITFPLGAYEALYGVTRSGTAEVYIYSVVN